jgi:hypothetical protein
LIPTGDIIPARPVGGEFGVESLNNLESAILRILEAHQGKGFACSRERLAEKVNGEQPLFPYSDRTIRKTIKHLITQHGVAIGSCHWGYFMAETSDEIEAVCRYYDSYGLSSLFVSSKLRKIEMRDYLGQLSMRFEMLK